MLDMIINGERSIDPVQSEKMITEFSRYIATKFDVKFSHYQKASTDCVFLENRDGEEITYGLGKGKYSKIGAFGECIEHFLYRDVGKLGCRSVLISELKNGEVAKNDVVVRTALKLAEEDTAIDCIDFKSTIDEQIVQVPCMYVNYHILDELKERNSMHTFLGRYVTNSGSAYGLTEDDAYLHALNETIERDLSSEFFLLLTGHGYSVKNEFIQVPIDTLPPDFTPGLEYLKQNYAVDKIDLFLSRTVFDTWYAICVVHLGDRQYILPQFGAGSSLYYRLAIYRSISEAIQMIDNYETENSTADRSLIEFIGNHDTLKNVITFDLSGSVPQVEYEPKNEISPMSTSDQIKVILEAMRREGFNTYKRTEFTHQMGYLVCSYTPGLEKFYNITKSVAVLPLQYLEKHA